MVLFHNLGTLRSEEKKAAMAKASTQTAAGKPDKL
jgi:hypothetical protein